MQDNRPIKREFEAAQGSLIIEGTDPNWCTFSMRTRDGKIELGRESFSSLTTKLISFLTNYSQEDKAPATDVANAIWVLSTMDPHGSLYAFNSEDGAILAGQDAEARWIASFSVTAGELADWSQDLVPYE